MTIIQTAEILGINLDKTLARLCGNEALYLRLLKKFPEDSSYAQLTEAVSKYHSGSNTLSDIEDSAHTLKGVAINLGLDPLGDAAHALVQCIRNGSPEQIDVLYATVSEQYVKAVETIQQL